MREFNITLTTNNKSGPFDIYYTSEGENVLAPLVNGNYATNISASQLTDGVDILADYGVSSIYVINKKETCDSIQSLPQTPESNPYNCLNLITKNNCDVEKTIQYIDCDEDTQTLTISPFDSVSYKGKINTTICISSNCDNCITTIPDPQYCVYYRITNQCSDVAVDIKYIDCSGTSKVVNIGPNQTVIIQAIANTVYNYGGDCGTPPDTEEIPDPYNPNPNATCQDFIAVNNCSLDAVISYTDCDGNVTTLNIPAGASIPFSSLSPDYKCYSGDCDCLEVYTPTETCGFDFLILGSYTPPVPPPPIQSAKLIIPKDKMNEGETIAIKVETTNIDDNTQLYWNIFSMAPTGFTIDDFNEINGLVTISKSLGTFNITTKNDLTTEGDQSFAVELWTDSNRTQSLAKSKFITIADTSVNPPTFNYGIRAYDTNKYTYEFPQTIDNIAVRPDYLSSPFSFKDISSGQPNKYFFRKNDTLINARIASGRLAPSSFPYISDFPFLLNSTFFGWFNKGVNTINQSWSGGNQYVYPLNNKVLYWDNTTYKNTNGSSFYLDGYAKDLPNSAVPLRPSINNEWYQYLTPRESTYALTGSVSISIQISDAQTFNEIFSGDPTQAGPAVFRIFGALEKSTDPSNASSWQKIAFTEMETLDSGTLQKNPYSPRNPTFLRPSQGSAFLYNPNDHLLWWDFLSGPPIEFNLKAQTDALIPKNSFIRFTLYWQDLNGVFAGLGDIKRGSNFVKFTIGGNPSKPSMFSILDKTPR